jgi:hypothetical protein
MRRAFLLFAAVFQFLMLDARADIVVGLHGFLTSSKSMKSIKKSLRRCGFEVCLWDYPSRRQCIEEHARNLIPYLQGIACRCPGQPIHFVTHSTGALVLRAALNMPGCPQEASCGRAVLLAPPNQGSWLARTMRNVWPIRWGMGNKSGWQLMHYCPSQIACFGEFPSTMHLLVLAGNKGNLSCFCEANDGFLKVSETAPNTPYYFQCFPVTHGELLTQCSVLSCICAFFCDCCDVQIVRAEPAAAGPGGGVFSIQTVECSEIPSSEAPSLNLSSSEETSLSYPLENPKQVGDSHLEAEECCHSFESVKQQL